MEFRDFLRKLDEEIISIPTSIPKVVKKSIIRRIEIKNNPISIYLDDGTKIALTYYEYRRIKNEPKVGKTMTVVFQRNPTDKTPMPSKIESIKVD